MKKTFILWIFSLVVFVPNLGFSKSKVEVMCRAKAKEIAITTYSGCITENRNKKIEKIRESYKKELQILKAKYDHALKDMSGSDALTTTTNTPSTASQRKNLKANIPNTTPVTTSTEDSAGSEDGNIDSIDADEVIEVQDL